MKNLILLSGFALLLLSSCGKNETGMGTPASVTSRQDEIRNIIQKANPSLYELMYNSKAPEVTVKVTPGSFVITSGGPDDGQCLSTNSICAIEIISPRYYTGTDTTFSEITEDYYATYDPSRVDATLIYNASPNPISCTPKSFTVDYTDGGCYLYHTE